MDFKIKIKCQLCKCRFELRPREFAGRESISCPNCGQKLDDSVYAHLQTGIIELAQVPSDIPEHDIPLFSLKLKEFPRDDDKDNFALD